MRQVVQRTRNKGHYRVLHVPVWLWTFFILPGPLTYDLYNYGWDERHTIWLAVAIAICAWCGFRGRLPGVEPQPYITHYGADQPNPSYRAVCYTAAWIDILVTFTLNLGIMVAAISGGDKPLFRSIYVWLYYPLALLVVLATLLDWTPRAKRSTWNEGVERAWFYVAIWTVVPAMSISWPMWKLGSRLGLAPLPLATLRLIVFLAVAGISLTLSLLGKLPRTSRLEEQREPASAPSQAAGAPAEGADLGAPSQASCD